MSKHPQGQSHAAVQVDKIGTVNAGGSLSRFTDYIIVLHFDVILFQYGFLNIEN